ncbi:MAG TPA: hypothetical protein VHV10_20555 [Ktedonobacteraceae bacterium]|nr:hypothetical protein [Ktedonobacteraceae bacterium]
MNRYIPPYSACHQLDRQPWYNEHGYTFLSVGSSLGFHKVEDKNSRSDVWAAIVLSV